MWLLNLLWKLIRVCAPKKLASTWLLLHIQSQSRKSKLQACDQAWHGTHMLIALALLQCRGVNQDNLPHPQKVYRFKDCHTSGVDFLPLSVYRNVMDSYVRLPVPHCMCATQVSTWHGGWFHLWKNAHLHRTFSKSLPSYLSVLLNQYIKPVPTRHIIYPENIWNSYKALSSTILQKLPRRLIVINEQIIKQIIELAKNSHP